MANARMRELHYNTETIGHSNTDSYLTC